MNKQEAVAKDKWSHFIVLPLCFTKGNYFLPSHWLLWIKKPFHNGLYSKKKEFGYFFPLKIDRS